MQLFLNRFSFAILISCKSPTDSSTPNKMNNLISFGSYHLQFIVVSLKEGMFNNANVLFRTKFVDGVSTVQRTVAKQNKWYILNILVLVSASVRSLRKVFIFWENRYEDSIFNWMLMYFEHPCGADVSWYFAYLLVAWFIPHHVTNWVRISAYPRG